MQAEASDPVAHHLAEIFERHLNLSERASDGEQITETRSSNDPATDSHVPIKYSISQHYTHSAHITAQSLHPLQPHRDDYITRLLIQNDIAPSSLLRSQIELFERCITDERARLIMLWRLAPPTYAQHGGQELADRLGEYQVITLETEEELAWLRYQRHHSRRDAQADASAEQLCGRRSVLGPYLDQGSVANTSVTPNATERRQQATLAEDEDEEML